MGLVLRTVFDIRTDLIAASSIDRGGTAAPKRPPTIITLRVVCYHETMKTPSPLGATPFDRVRPAITDDRCRDCGHVDERADWNVRVAGREVRYERTCRSCGATNRRALHIPA